MLLVKTKIDKDSFGGHGLFAAEFIPSGTIIWENHTDSEWIISPETFSTLSEYMQNQFKAKGYLDKSTREWKLPLDDARFMNHSYVPNTYQHDDGHLIAAKDINPGEEIFCNYLDFDAGAGHFKP